MERSDIFISYRRKDVDFVKRLDAAFKASGREVWIDWEDIPPGVRNFSAEIHRGVESSDIFIAVLSPNYLESDYCLAELAYAAKQGKKIIPLVYQKFEGLPVPDSISHINWIYFCEHAGQTNTFGESFPRVIEAIETDFEHVREHTRLLLRAREWEDSQRQNSYLLDGLEIATAETWLAGAALKKPPATSLQIEFIQASRQAETERQTHELALKKQAVNRLRYLVGMMLLAALVSGGLLIYALLLQQQREQERIEKFYENGSIYLSEGNFAGAVVELSNSLEDSNEANTATDLTFDETEAYYKRGLAYYGLADYAAAVQDFDRVLNVKSDFAEGYNARGLAYHALGDYSTAIENFTQALEQNPDFATAYLNRGGSYFALNDGKKALADYETALTLTPEDAEAYYRRGQAYFAVEDYGRAEEDFKSAIRLRPDFAEAYYQLGLTFMAQDDIRAAIGNFTQAAVHKIGYAEAYYQLALAFRDQIEQETIKNYEFALQFNLTYADDAYFYAVFPDVPPTPTETTTKSYTTQAGESLVSIALENDVSVQQLLELNNLTTVFLPPETELKIPVIGR